MKEREIGKIRFCRWGVVLLCFLFSGVYGQQGRMSWEEAGIQAARENKLVFVAVGMEPDRKVFSGDEVRLFFTRHTIGTVIEMQGETGRQFRQKLLLTPYPVYAFFMPFGDLLVTVDPEDVVRNPQRLLDAGAEALRLAEIKRTNSREIRFQDIPWPEILQKGQTEEKPVFAYFRQPTCRECLLMEQNVFKLDRVADFYNRNFINRQITVVSGDSLSGRYGIKEFPAFLFLNGEGKELYRKEGPLSAEEMIAGGEKALMKARGVVFVQDTWEQAVRKAGREGKHIFADTYAAGGGEQRNRAAKLFRDPEVARFFNEHFVNVAYDGRTEEGEKFRERYAIRLPFAFCFFDENGGLLHRVTGAATAEELLQEARLALEGKGLAFMRERYERGDREEQFLEQYIGLLIKAGEKREAEQVTARYLEQLPPDSLKEDKYWDLFRNYFCDADSPLFGTIRARKTEFYSLYGKEEVDAKINEIWTLGAGNFIKDEGGTVRFDEAGFKEYAKRLKKEKVTDYRKIIRNARMKAAGETGDWKTFSVLAEERWNEEKIPEKELYAWGITIEENCRNKSIRYKVARWFALAAAEMERKEQLSGKVNVSSYKGFFEKLVNDLVEK